MVYFKYCWVYVDKRSPAICGMSLKNTNILFDPLFPGNSNSSPCFPIHSGHCGLDISSVDGVA